MKYKEMKDKYDYMQKFGVETKEDIATTLAVFGAFTEGLQLFASFAIYFFENRVTEYTRAATVGTWDKVFEKM